MAVTIRDVAEAAGVSVATVSRSLRGSQEISEATRLRVITVARELGYESQSRRTERKRVALVMPYVGRWYFSQVLEGVEGVLRGKDIDVIVHRLVDLDDRRLALLGHLPGHEVDAVILVSMMPAEDEIRVLRDRAVPLSLIGVAHPDVPHVRIDDVAAGRAAASHLISLGHRRIALVSGARYERIPFAVAPERRRGFLQSLNAAGLDWDPSFEVYGDFTAAGARAAIAPLLEREDRPTAVVAESDEMGFGVAAAAASYGLRVPEDLSVVGIDDHDLAETLGLTTVAQPVTMLGELAAWQVVGRLQNRPPSTLQGQSQLSSGGRVESVVLPTSLVVRSSTGRPTGA